jgi:steroid delta-isomerase-like uncharacterized protein
MDAQEMKDTTRRWMTGIFDNGDFDLINELTADEYTFDHPRLGLVKREAFTDMVNVFRTACPDLNNTFEEQVVEGNVVVTRGTTRGTHLGPFGDLPATGKTVALPWVVFTRFDGDRIVEDWQVYDGLRVMNQLGVIAEDG